MLTGHDDTHTLFEQRDPYHVLRLDALRRQGKVDLPAVQRLPQFGGGVLLKMKSDVGARQ